MFGVRSFVFRKARGSRGGRGHVTANMLNWAGPNIMMAPVMNWGHTSIARSRSSMMGLTCSLHTQSWLGKGEDLKKRQEQLMGRNLPKRKSVEGVGKVVLVASGKGGVGKSTTAVNLALALAQSPAKNKVGLLDTDVFGPSIPDMMAVSELPLLDSNNKMLPVQNYGVGCMSMGLLVDPQAALVWRGPMVMGALEKLVHGTNWSGTDILAVDTPPGTGDIHLSLAQTVEIAGAIIVTTPQKVALSDARKGVDMYQKMGVPLLGVVENMASFVCGTCQAVTHVFGSQGVEGLSNEEGIPVLGSIPLDPSLMASSDCGHPLVLSQPQSAVATTYREIAQKVIKSLAA